MQTLSAEKRSKIILDYGKLLLENSDKITEANNLDLDLAKKHSKYDNYIMVIRIDLKEFCVFRFEFCFAFATFAKRKETQSFSRWNETNRRELEHTRSCDQEHSVGGRSFAQTDHCTDRCIVGHI